MKPTDLQSKVIAFMRFPLLVLLLFLHCNFTTLGEEWASLPFASHFINIFSQRVAPIVFPVSFFIAGYPLRRIPVDPQRRTASDPEYTG